MRHRQVGIIGACIIVACGTGTAGAATVEELEQRLERQETEMQQLRDKVAAFEHRERAHEAEQQGQQIAAQTWPEQAETFAKREEGPAFGGVRSKPFLRRFGRNTYVGGYADIVYKDSQAGNAAFDQQRLVPFIYSDVSDRIGFAAEIEFEHGGPDAHGDPGEAAVEFATIDYRVADPLNFRGGIILSPLSKLNLVHDSPAQDLSERPLVDQFVVPTTLSEAGMGVFGSVHPTETARVDYEGYLVNGFRGLTGESASDVTINRTDGLREARPSQSRDINDEPAFVGRVSVSPFLGLELGGATHLGTYDTKGNNMLGIFELDGAYQLGPFELLAEGAYASIERNALAKSLGVPNDFYGYYLQGNYHFMPELLRQSAPKIFTEESTFTFVNRWDWVNLDQHITGRYTVGLNFRPTEDTVFKTDFQFNQEYGDLDSVDDNALIVSAATYF